MGNLLVAWTFVTGLAAAIASAWYSRTGDIKVLIAYLGAPFLIGVVLFVSLGLYLVATREARRDPIEPCGQPHRRGEGFFGRAAPPPGAHRARAPDAGAAPVDPMAWERVTLRARAGEEELTEYHRVSLEPRHVKIAMLVLALAASVGWAQVLAPALLQVDPFRAAPAALLGAGVVLLAILLARPRHLAKRAVRQETHFETTWRVGPDGLEMVDARGRGRYRWEDVQVVRESGGIFVVRTRDGASLVIPKRAAGPESVERMRMVMRMHAGERAVLRGA